MIAVESLHIRLGHFALCGVSFRVPTGRYGMLMGKTGTGKTTILEAIAGLRPVIEGRITLGDQEVTHLRPALRHVGLVPQDGALFTTMTVREQLAFALVVRQRPMDEMLRRVDELAELLEIGPLLDRLPQGLSGGEKQRVALGRALAFHPTTLLLDEPLSALDDTTRAQIIDLLKRVQRETHVTTLHITHNKHEALALGDVLLELAEGRVRPVEAVDLPA